MVAEQRESEADIESLRQKIIDSETNRVELKEKVDRSKKLLDESCEIKKNNELEQSKLQEVAASNEQYQTQISGLIESNETVESDLKNCLNEKGKLVGELESTRSECDQIQTEFGEKLESAESRADKAEKYNNCMTTQHDDVIQELKNLRAKLGVYQPVYFNRCCNNGCCRRGC